MRSHSGSMADLNWDDPWVWAVPLLAALSALAVLLGPGNQDLFLTLNASSAPAGAFFWSNITIFGNPVVAMALVLPFAIRRPEIAWTALIAGLLTVAWVCAPKWLIGLPRPTVVLPLDSFTLFGPSLRSSPSFPSGHATTAVAIATSVALHYRRTWAGIGIATLGVFIAYSRIAVGVHWPLDVLAGIGGGWLAAIIAYRVTQQKMCMQNCHHQRRIVALFFGPPIALLLGYDAGQPHTIVLAWIIGFTSLYAGCLAWQKSPLLQARE